MTTFNGVAVGVAAALGFIGGVVFGGHSMAGETERAKAEVTAVHAAMTGVERDAKAAGFELDEQFGRRAGWNAYRADYLARVDLGIAAARRIDAAHPGNPYRTQPLLPCP